MVEARSKKLKGPEPDATTDETVHALIQLVGNRVRGLRKAHRFSRRELSEVSGVSQRYLAQLESGEGNISIGLLKRISLAFDQPMEAMVCDDSEDDALAHLVANFKQADNDTKNRVQHLLDPNRRREKKAERICLVGLRGAGKSTLGALLADQLGFKFIELNAEIERSAGIPISEIIALYGQEGYRQLESEVLESVVESHSRLVLAVAGGIVSEENTFSQVLTCFHTVWIQASPTEHMERVRAQGDTRPMAGNPKAMEQLKQILRNRELLYSRAEYHLNTSGSTVANSNAELLELLNANAVITNT